MYFIKLNPVPFSDEELAVVDSGGELVTFQTRQGADAYAFYLLYDGYEICELPS